MINTKGKHSYVNYFNSYKTIQNNSFSNVSDSIFALDPQRVDADLLPCLSAS